MTNEQSISAWFYPVRRIKRHEKKQGRHCAEEKKGNAESEQKLILLLFREIFVRYYFLLDYHLFRLVF